ncbi:hypothetical protein BAOM_3004 [Peribacillus asahii]|uniref:Uncharacterized protein n=1 Tax=Peribacillus asahii TaxID=228899 RepID=A0A3Q9RPV4_9BACI|nr:hypothetical protein [Peribacillus asahii]AZV43613.1 hypothetical protein BAOM_3004 [Peribacillus asahii]
MSKIKIPYKLANSIELIKSEKGEEYLYKIEWLISYFKNTVTFEDELQEAINYVVSYIKESDVHRKTYFKVLVDGYEKQDPSSFRDLNRQDKEIILEGLTNVIKGYIFNEKTYKFTYNHERGTGVTVKTGTGIPLMSGLNGTATITIEVNGGAEDTY